MNRDERERQRSEMRVALKRGDPAGDDRGLDPAEIVRMRRRVLEAADAGRAWGWLPVALPRLAAYAGAAFVVVAAGWVVLQNLPTRVDAPPSIVEKTMPVPPAAVPPAEVVAEIAMEDDLPAAPLPDIEPPPHAAAPQETAVAVLPPTVSPPAEPVTRVAARPLPGQPRQMQFVTARGTRIIWTLDPAFDLGRLMPTEKGETS